MKSIAVKRSKKQQRELEVLLGLVELYISTGKAIGSNTLREFGFKSLSSATIRNYFASLEIDGYLQQQHASGGRVPTDRAFRVYAEEVKGQGAPPVEDEIEKSIESLRSIPSREVAGYLQRVGELLSNQTGTAVFLSAPRFDQDVIVKLQVVPVDLTRCLAIILTSFGLVKTELLHRKEEIDLTDQFTSKIERYFQWRLQGGDKPDDLAAVEERLAQHYYNELMVRYLVGYSNFPDDEIYRTGFSQTLLYPEFSDAAEIAKGLSLFENLTSMRHLLKKCVTKGEILYWVGDDLKSYSSNYPNCSVIAIPYCVNDKPVGAIALLGPTRIPYRELFGVMDLLSRTVSQALSSTLFKLKITCREAEKSRLYIDQSAPILLEDKREE